MYAPVSVSRIGCIHVGEERRNVGKGNLHCASPDGSTAFGYLPGAVLLGEYLDDVDVEVTAKVAEVGTEAEALAEINPYLLGLNSGDAGRSHDAPLTVFMDSAESIKCIVADVGRQSFQERDCG